MSWRPGQRSVGQRRDGSHRPRGKRARGCGGKSDFRGNYRVHLSLRSSGNLVGVAFRAYLGVGYQTAGGRQEARMAQPAPSRGPAVKDA